MAEIRGLLHGCCGNLGQLKLPRSYENDPNEDIYSTGGYNVSTAHFMESDKASSNDRRLYLV